MIINPYVFKCVIISLIYTTVQKLGISFFFIIIVEYFYISLFYYFYQINEAMRIKKKKLFTKPRPLNKKLAWLLIFENHKSGCVSHKMAPLGFLSGAMTPKLAKT